MAKNANNCQDPSFLLFNWDIFLTSNHTMSLQYSNITNILTTETTNLIFLFLWGIACWNYIILTFFWEKPGSRGLKQAFLGPFRNNVWVLWCLPILNFCPEPLKSGPNSRPWEIDPYVVLIWMFNAIIEHFP